MASAQILQLYYTKDNKSQSGNQSEYRYQHSKAFLHGPQTFVIPSKYFQLLPQNNNNLSKFIEHSYHSHLSDNNSQQQNRKEAVTIPCHQVLFYKNSFTSNIEKNSSRTTTTTTHHTSWSAPYKEDENNNNNIDDEIEADRITTKDYITTKKTCLWWKHIFNFARDKTEDDANSVVIYPNVLDDCEVPFVVHTQRVSELHPTYFECHSGLSEATTEISEAAFGQQNNHMDDNGEHNNHFQYDIRSLFQLQMPSTPTSLLSPIYSFTNSNDNSEESIEGLVTQHLSGLSHGVDTIITGRYKQCSSWDKRKNDDFLLRAVRRLRNSESSTISVNFVAATDSYYDEIAQGENNYATPIKTRTTEFDTNTDNDTKSKNKIETTKTTSQPSTATTTNRKPKNCATSCQNNAINGIDQTCFLQSRIDFSRNDSLIKSNQDCLLCKFKPNTCHESRSTTTATTKTTRTRTMPECCEQSFRDETKIFANNQVQWNWNDHYTKQLQSSINDKRSLSLLQSTTSGSTITTDTPDLTKPTTISSRLSSNQQKQQQQEQLYAAATKSMQQNPHQTQKSHTRQQRTTNLFKQFPSSFNDNTASTPSAANKNKDTPTTTADSGSRMSCRKFCEHAINAFVDVQRVTCAILPLLIIFNILPLLYAVASNFDATEVKGGPNPNASPWMPVVAHLEPLPRPKTKSPKCDQTFVSRVGGPQNGTFSAPIIHNPKNHSRQCLYIFLAGPGQRVEVVFTTFNLRGSPPDGSAVGELPSCVHEYMDIYSEVQSSDPADLINSPFGGRFCGTIPPRRRISMHRAIAISFFTNKNVSEPDLFEGRFRFLNASEYEIGIPIAGSPCSYTITPSMSINKTGALISPTYPGAYPKDMSCTYQFLGETNQRVRLEFRDFDLFFGGPHCPFDYVKVYDGPDNSSALIGTYCGQQRNLVIYSSESSLFVHFYTLPRTANTQNRGFKGIYEFSESFVKLDFIRENDGIHIRGTECDQKILSKKESTGYVLSPNYPYPYIPKTVCRYFIYGMQDAQHLERVRLEFSAFNIPKVEQKDKGETNCSDGYLKIYLKGQETVDAYDKFDYELCGNETQKVVSDGPRLAMVFSSGELQGRGFKGRYIFETEYKIPGTAAPDGTCSFTYVSSSKKRGELNSPRYPSNYPSETNCSYLFLAEPNEQVTIVFDHFKVKADNVNSTAGAYGASACFEDWLEMYVIYRDNNDRFLGRYCGLTAPGPVESPRGAVGLRITLHTDQENVASGFKARYYFEAAKSDIGDCGGNFSNADSGIITSPHYPSNYKSPAKGMASMACNWYITARSGYKLSINFEHFSVEGDPMARGCPAAVLRMWINADSDAAPIELCGEKPPTEHWHHISTGQSARISFTTTDKTIGAQGFRIVWTEIQDTGPGPPAIGLLCESTYHFQCNVGYCISDKLRCDGVKNCGPDDDSDEMHCITEAPKEDHGVLIIISMAAVSFLICLLCTLCHRQKKRRHRQLGLHRNTGHYDSTTSATGLSSSRRHLQSGGSLSGSLHGINSGTLIIPPAPLPPTSVPPPPHICIAGTGAGGGMGMGGMVSDMMLGAGLDDDDDNDDDEDNPDIFINDIRFDENNLDQLEAV